MLVLSLVEAMYNIMLASTWMTLRDMTIDISIDFSVGVSQHYKSLNV